MKCSLLTVLLVTAGFAAAAPVPKPKPIPEDQYIGTWKIEVTEKNGNSQTGVLELRGDYTYVAVLDETVIYSGIWSYKDDHLSCVGHIYCDHRDVGEGGFYVKMSSFSRGVDYDNNRFVLTKEK